MFSLIRLCLTAVDWWPNGRIVASFYALRATWCRFAYRCGAGLVCAVLGALLKYAEIYCSPDAFNNLIFSLSLSRCLIQRRLHTRMFACNPATVTVTSHEDSLDDHFCKCCCLICVMRFIWTFNAFHRSLHSAETLLCVKEECFSILSI